MTFSDTDRLMHAVLDGEASPEEARRLEQVIAGDPAARERFEDLKRLFSLLGRDAAKEPPPGLQYVIIHKASQHFAGSSISNAGTHQPLPGGAQMSQQASGKRKVWIGVAVTAAAALVVGHYVFDIPASGEYASGTVAPAQRYRAPQVKSENVQLGDQSVAKLLQDENVDKALKDPAFQQIAANPQAFHAIAANPQAFHAFHANAASFQALSANTQAMKAISAHPQAFHAIAANPAAFLALAAKPQAFHALASNPQALSALAANPQAFHAAAQAQMKASSASASAAASASMDAAAKK